MSPALFALPAIPEYAVEEALDMDLPAKLDAASPAEAVPSDEQAGEWLPDGTLFILDWDDSLCPTYWLRGEGLLSGGRAVGLPNSEQQGELNVIALRVAALIEKMLQLGRVLIITNASAGWVKESCLRFMPWLYSFISKLPVISARSTYERRCARKAWKCRAFQGEVAALYNSLKPGHRANIIVLGDDFYEHDALLASTQGLRRCWTKSLKMLGCPSAEQVISQLETVAENIEDTVWHAGDVWVSVVDSDVVPLTESDKDVLRVIGTANFVPSANSDQQ